MPIKRRRNKSLKKSTENPTPTLEYSKRKYQTLLNNIGGEWHLNNMCNSKLPKYNTMLSNKYQEEYIKTKDLLKAACDHCKYWKFQIHGKKLEYVVPIKCDTKKTPFFMPSNKFLKDVPQDNHWFGELVMKPAYAMAFRKRKAKREGNHDKIGKFEMEILDEGLLYKAL